MNIKISLFLGLLFLSQVGQQAMAQTKTAIFAGGCFWCLEPPFDKLKEAGVLDTVVGYTGGKTDNPTYEQISSGKTGHKEVIKIVYDSQKISYQELLSVFWKNIDPFDGIGQFCDKGDQYQSAVYYLDEEQKNDYLQSLEALKKKGIEVQNFKTQLLKAAQFYPAEDYHQDYYVKNPVRYKYYRFSCGRDKRLEQVWGQ